MLTVIFTSVFSDMFIWCSWNINKQFMQKYIGSSINTLGCLPYSAVQYEFPVTLPTPSVLKKKPNETTTTKSHRLGDPISWAKYIKCTFLSMTLPHKVGCSSWMLGIMVHKSWFFSLSLYVILSKILLTGKWKVIFMVLEASSKIRITFHWVLLQTEVDYLLKRTYKDLHLLEIFNNLNGKLCSLLNYFFL